MSLFLLLEQGKYIFLEWLKRLMGNCYSTLFPLWLLLSLYHNKILPVIHAILKSPSSSVIFLAHRLTHMLIFTVLQQHMTITYRLHERTMVSPKGPDVTLPMLMIIESLTLVVWLWPDTVSFVFAYHYVWVIHNFSLIPQLLLLSILALSF